MPPFRDLPFSCQLCFSAFILFLSLPSKNFSLLRAIDTILPCMHPLKTTRFPFNMYLSSFVDATLFRTPPRSSFRFFWRLTLDPVDDLGTFLGISPGVYRPSPRSPLSYDFWILFFFFPTPFFSPVVPPPVSNSSVVPPGDINFFLLQGSGLPSNLPFSSLRLRKDETSDDTLSGPIDSPPPVRPCLFLVFFVIPRSSLPPPSFPLIGSFGAPFTLASLA